MTVLTNNINW